MSDARQNLSDALANAKARQSKAPPKPAAPPKPKAAPPRNTSARTPSSKPKTTKKAPKKKALRRKKSGGGSALFKNFQSFASTVIDELKHATAEISPGALISQANDGLKSIKKAVGLDDEHGVHPASAETGSAHAEDRQEDKSEARTEINRATSQLPNTDQIPATATPPSAHAPAAATSPSAKTPPAKTTSPAKVKRALSKKKTTEAEEATAHADSAAISSETFEQVIEAGENPGRESDEVGTASPAEVTRAASKTEQNASEETPAAEEPAELAPEPETPATEQPAEPAPEAKAEAPEPKTDEPQVEKRPETPQKRKPAPKAQGTVVSKAEHAVRNFRSLQIILNNPIWMPIIVDLKSRPSTLYAPRERFDAQFADPVFREGLKAASRLASSYAFDPEKILFNEQIIERVKSLDLDPNGKIKAHTENITSVIDKNTIEAVIEMLKDGNVKHLLYSVSTRLGTFVPTIESLARIYLGLRRKEQLNSGDRLQLQEEILMRYRKAPYTEEMGKKARNLALNYFMDYLVEYGLKLYKDRIQDVPEGQNNPTSQYKRHINIVSFSQDMIDEWSTRVALSTQAIEIIKTKFSENALQFLRETVGEPPPDL